VVAGNKLWFTTGCDQWGSQLASMNFDGSHITTVPSTNGESWTYCADIEWSDSMPNILFMHGTGISPQALDEYDVSSGRAKHVGASDFDWGNYNGGPVAALSDGKGFAMTSSSGVSVYRMKDMTGPTFTYTGVGNTALATSGASGGLIAGAQWGPSAAEVSVWHQGEASAFATFDVPDGSGGGIWPHGLVFAGDGTQLVAVSGANDTEVIVHALDPFHPELAAPSPSTAAPPSVPAGVPGTVAAPQPLPVRTAVPFVPVIVIGALLGLIVGAVARNKGYNFALWWLFGFLIFIVAVIVILAMPRKTGRERASSPPSFAPVGGMPIPPPPVAAGSSPPMPPPPTD
jgi:hypothetical protein